ncbi:hypothetical protein K470DRAFT_270078 [Piedraia hortae CBS 480.64]|uniref:Uncharacterized protein n=1 Tax=Piedraia hortae CBS 480.64 TaxID=1314780 RepID=A0A6A7C150_9PEZI|nr:hypothetical protein K470DRAFT_270078 [Piedraia hortae CBS 480.64]
MDSQDAEIARQMMLFAPVFDVESNVILEVLCLPWAGISSILMSILEEIEVVLGSNHLLTAYSAIYSQVDATSALAHLYNHLVTLYGLIREFLAHAHRTYDMHKWEETAQCLADVVIPNFEANHDRVLEIIEHHARTVDREVSEKQQAWVTEKLKTLKKHRQRSIKELEMFNKL